MLSPFTQAEYQLLDRVVAIVEDDIVMSSEVRDSMLQIKTTLKKRGTTLPSEAVLYEQVLERAILEKLQLQRAYKMGLRISDQQLNEAMSNIAMRNGLSLQQFKTSLENNNESYVTVREKIRHDLLIQQTQRRNVFRKIHISKSEINNFLASEQGKALLQPELNIDHVLLPVDSKASDAAQTRAQQKMAELRSALLQNPSSKNFASAVSKVQSLGAQHSPLGWRNLSDLPSLFIDTVSSMSAGDISAPIKSGSGYHLIWLTEKRGGVDKTVNETLVKHILISLTEIRNDKEAEQLANKIKQKLDAGELFDTLAKQHSEDPGSALLGGALGWTKPGKLVPVFEYVMDSTKIGQISQPFKSEFGWHILEVTDRRSKDLSNERAERLAQMQIAETKYDSALQNWLQELRDNAFIEIKWVLFFNTQ